MTQKEEHEKVLFHFARLTGIAWSTLSKKECIDIKRNAKLLFSEANERHKELKEYHG